MNYLVLIGYLVRMILVIVGIYVYNKRKKQNMPSLFKTKKVKVNPEDELSKLESGTQSESVKVEVPASPETTPHQIVITEDALQKVKESHNSELIIPGVEFRQLSIIDLIEQFKNMSLTMIAMQKEIEDLSDNLNNRNGNNLIVESEQTELSESPSPQQQEKPKRKGRVFTEEQKKAFGERMKKANEAKKAEKEAGDKID